MKNPQAQAPKPELTVDEIHKVFPEIYNQIFDFGYHARGAEIWADLEKTHRAGISYEGAVHDPLKTAAAEIAEYKAHGEPLTAAVLNDAFPEIYLTILEAGAAKAEGIDKIFALDYAVKAQAKASGELAEHYRKNAAAKPTPPPATRPTPPPAPDPPKPLTFAEHLEVEWQRSPALRAEFRGNFGHFAAFTKAKARGVVRIFGQR